MNRRLTALTVSGIRPGSCGGGSLGLAGGGAWVSVWFRARAAVTAQTARAAIASTVWRKIAVYSRTWDWSSPK